jgi:hypothetical protein
MARFVFGKGKKKTYWDIEQFGRVLRTQETDPRSQYLPAFRRFADERAARAESERFIVERLGKKFSPEDDAALELAARLSRLAPPAPPAPKLPLRGDLYVYNEATGFMVTSMQMAGKALEEGSNKWNKAVTDARMIPVTLFQDDPFVIRVVAGDALTPQEAEEWVGKIEWRLNVPDGKLAITGGAVLVNEEYDPDDPYYESYLRTMDIPPGFYRATIYSYVPGINGSGALDSLAKGHRKGEAFGTWFRRTRPGETFPAWLRDWCIGDPSTDPDHREEWKSAKRLENSEIPDYVHFLVHLEPASRLNPAKPSISDGWFGEAHGARRPEKCPLGLEGRDVGGHEENVTSSGWIYVQEVPQSASRFPAVAIEGGPLELVVGDLCNLYRLGWFSHSLSVPEIRAALPQGSSFALPTEWPGESIALQQEGTLRIAFSNDVKPGAIIPLLEKMGSELALVPEGTELELVCSQADPAVLEADVPIGLHRYRGRITNGKWRIDEAFPRISAGALRAALALSEEVAAGDSIAVKDKAEGDAILKFAKGNHGPWIEDNPGTITGGKLTLRKREPKVLALYGAAAFAVRFRQIWPVLDMSEDEEEEAVDLTIPIQGRKVLETLGGRMYFATMALMVSEKLAETIQREERFLRGRGYRHVGDVVCNLFPKIAVRGYAHEGGDAWACFLVGSPDTLLFEISTRFDKDAASLLTTRQPGAKDDPSKHSFRQSITAGDYTSMFERHEARKAELAATYGPPIKVERTHAALADAVEAGLKKQFGG